MGKGCTFSDPVTRVMLNKIYVQYPSQKRLCASASDTAGYPSIEDGLPGLVMKGLLGHRNVMCHGNN